MGCLETSVRNYHYSLRNNPEDCYDEGRVNKPRMGIGFFYIGASSDTKADGLSRNVGKELPLLAA